MRVRPRRARAEDPAPLESVLDDASLDAPSPDGPAPVTPRRRARVPFALRAGAPAWVWAGMAVMVAGFVLIAVGWGQVAAETQVYLQLPYVVSAALVGLGLVMVGLTVVNVATRNRDARERERQVAHLAAILDEVRQLLAEREGSGRRR